MTGRDLVRSLGQGVTTRPPYVPILGRLAMILGQVDEATFTADAHAQSVAVLQTAAALGADAVTVGYASDPSVGCDALQRLRAVAADRALVACMSEPDVAGVRAYCEAGADLVVLLAPDRSRTTRFRTIANACAFYSVLAILVDPDLPDAAAVAADLGLHGAVVASPGAAEPGVVGGGLSPSSLDPAGTLAAPRAERFFWSFAGQVPADLNPEALAALGRRLS